MRVALLGAGTVGGAVARIAAARPDLGIEVVGAFVRDLAREREGVRHLTTDAFDLLDDEGIAAIVEVLGGEEPARSLILAALERGKHIVSANKLVLARHWGELREAARSARRQLRYEAAVAAAIPLFAALRALAAARVARVRGILNGTTNFILTRMEDGVSFDDALRQAQAAGYAEADPSSDVDGWDPAYKLAILLAELGGRPFPVERVERTPLRGIDASRLERARRRGARLRYVATAELAGAVRAEIAPIEVPETSLLGTLRGPENAVEIETDIAGTIGLRGPGAGGDATASAILGDLLAIARAS